MISNLTISEIKEFFTGDLIAELNEGRYYFQKVQVNKYQVQDPSMNTLGYVEGK